MDINNKTDNTNTDPSTSQTTADGAALQAQLETLRAELAQASSEAAKYRSQRNDVVKERDELKKRVGGDNTPAEQNYKQLFETAQKEVEQLRSVGKSQAINAAVTARLTKLGVQPDKIDAAVKLVDRSMVEWDPETGVDATSVDAASLLLKKDFGFLFEQKVSGATPKEPGTTRTDANTKVINRSDFERLSPTEKVMRMKDGWQVKA